MPGRTPYTALDAETIIRKLKLAAHPSEGGYFAETYRAEESIPRSALPQRYGSDKAASTAIYYLLTPGTFSEMHQLKSDEVYHFYAGDPVEMLVLKPDGTSDVITIGSDLDAGQVPQVVVSRQWWQGSRLKPGGEFALLGTTMAPAFDYEDCERGIRDELVSRYPGCAELIRRLTRG